MDHKTTSKPTPNPSISLMYFFILTTVYIFMKMNTTSDTEKKLYVFIYLLFLVIGQFFINLTLTESVCGIRQWQTALNVTSIPWILIFGVLNMFLYLFPDWKKPFSNTFGYGIAKMMGVNDFLDEILLPPFAENAQLDANTKAIAQSLEHIYSDRSILINEITDPATFWEKMKKTFKPGVYESKNINDSIANKFVQLKRFLNAKDYTSEYIWYMLSGALVTSVSYNYLVNMTCSRSLKEMTARKEKYDRDELASQEKKQQRDAANSKVYTTTS